MRIQRTIEQLTAIQNAYEQIKRMPMGSVLYIDGVRYTRRSLRASTRARDKGKFVSVPKIMSLQEWIEYYTQYGNKRPLYELFKSQVILGHDAKGGYSWTYSNAKYKRKKAKLFSSTITNEVKYNLFATPAPDKANLFYTGAAFNSLFGSKIFYNGERIMFDYSSTLFANRMRVGYGKTMISGLFPRRQEGFGLNDISMDFFIKNILTKFVENLRGTITDFE